CQRGTETFFVGTTFISVDGVGKSVRGFLVALVPLHGYLNLVFIALDIKSNHGGVNSRLGLIEELDVINQTIWVVVRNLLLQLLLGRTRRLHRRRCNSAFFYEVIYLFIIKRGLIQLLFAGFRVCDGFEIQLFFGHALINELNGQTLIKECHLLQTTRNGVIVILDGLEDLRIRPKSNLGSGSTRVAAFLELFRDGVIKDLVPVLAVSLNFRFDAGRQRVDNGDTDAVQTTGDG